MAEGVQLPRKALGRVNVKEGPSLRQTVSDVLDRLNNAGLVVDVHHRNEVRVGSHGVENGVRVDCTALVGRHECDVEAAPSELRERLEHGVMLDGGGHDVTPLPGGRRQTEDREVVALGRAAREDHVAASAVDDRGDLVAGALDGRPRPAAPLMGAAAGVAEVVVQEPHDLGADPRVEGRRGGAIEVDRHLKTSFCSRTRRMHNGADVLTP